MMRMTLGFALPKEQGLFEFRKLAMAIALGLAVFSLGGLTNGSQDAQAQTQQIKPITLSKPLVNAFLNSMPDIQALADKYDGQFAESDGPLGGLENLGISASVQKELNDTVLPHGFGDYKTWILVAQNVMSTFIYVKVGDVMREMPKAMEEAMANAMASIKNNPNMTPEQRTALLQKMQKMSPQKPVAAAPPPSAANIAVVTEMLPIIEARMQSMGQQ